MLVALQDLARRALARRQGAVHRRVVAARLGGLTGEEHCVGDGPRQPETAPGAEAPVPQPASALAADEPAAAERRRRSLAIPAWLVYLVVVAVALGGAIRYTKDTRAFLPSWIRWNYSGYESKPAYAEFR